MAREGCDYDLMFGLHLQCELLLSWEMVGRNDLVEDCESEDCCMRGCVLLGLEFVCVSEEIW